MSDVSIKTLIYQTFPTSRAEHDVGVLGAGLGHVIRTGGVLRHGCHHDVTADSLPEPSRNLLHATVWNENTNCCLLAHLQKGTYVI